MSDVFDCADASVPGRSNRSHANENHTSSNDSSGKDQGRNDQGRNDQDHPGQNGRNHSASGHDDLSQDGSSHGDSSHDSGNQDLPGSPDEAASGTRLDLTGVQAALDQAHDLIWKDEAASDLSVRLELTFRAYDPESRLSEVSRCPTLGREWMRYQCDLTGMHVAVKRGAPIPVIAAWQVMSSGRKVLARCLKAHPGLLGDRGWLLELLASKLEDCVADGIFGARKALSGLQFMDGRSELPGVQTGKTCYPRESGYRSLGRRPPSEQG